MNVDQIKVTIDGREYGLAPLPREEAKSKLIIHRGLGYFVVDHGYKWAPTHNFFDTVEEARECAKYWNRITGWEIDDETLTIEERLEVMRREVSETPTPK